MSDKKKLREELAGLTAELAALRAEVAQLRAAHSCHAGCFAHGHCNWGHCWCYITSPYWTVTTVTTPNTSGGSGSLSGTFTQGAAGYNPNPVMGYSITNGVVTGSGYTVSASN